MKTTILFFFMSTLFITAQVTHDLNWSTASGTNLDLTIDQGDTVRWTWNDALPHTVESTGGVDPFNSGAIQTGFGETYEYKFDILGDTDYRCGVHTSTMQGTITVLSTASIEDYQTVEFNYSPNPVEDKLSINAGISISKVEIYSMLGQKILTKNLNSNSVNIDISSFKKNLYFAKLQFEDNSFGVFRIIKK